MYSLAPISEKRLLYTRVAAPKAPKRRSRAGCNYCKDKKKKCDEARPSCSRCRERGQQCCYEQVRPRQRHNIQRGHARDSYNSLLAQLSATMVPSTPAASEDTGTEVGDLRAENQCAQLIMVRLSVHAPEYTLEDEDLSGSSYFEPNSVAKTEATEGLLIDNFYSSPLDFCAPAFEEFSPNFHHRRLMDHFCNTLSHLIVLREDGENPFQKLILPLAYESDSVQNAIYALADAHLEAKGVDNQYSDGKALQFHTRAVRGLSTLIEEGCNVKKNEMLATIILLVYYEVLVQRRQSSLIEAHLKGAMAIMRDCYPLKDQTSVFLNQAFQFHDVITALSTGTRPVSDESSDGNLTAFSQHDIRHGTTLPQTSVDPLLGLATTLWPIIHKLSSLLSLKSDVEKSAAQPELHESASLRSEFDARCSDVESALHEWQPTLPAGRELCVMEGQAQNTVTTERQLQSILNTALAYRHSALVYLHRTIYDCPRQHPIVQHHTSASLLHCAATVENGGPMGALLWPLFVASCEATLACDRALAREAFKGIGERQGMTNIDRAWMVVQEVWNRADEAKECESQTIGGARQGQKDLLWRRVSDEMGMFVVFG